MSRPNFTYRGARRNEWRDHNALSAERMTWFDMNRQIKSWPESKGFDFGPVLHSDYAGGAHFLGGRSKYTPHIGAKERARHSGKPDGAMHRTPHEHRAFCAL